VNRGLQLARGAELILINQDVVLRADCLAALSAQLAHGPAIVGCKLLYPDGVTLQHAGGIIRWPRAIADHYGYRQPDDGRWNTVRDVDYVTGAVVVLNRAVLETIGLLDEGFYPAYYEEVDYCFRARAAHARVIYEPLAVAIHYESQSTDKRTPAYHRAMERGRVRFVLKYSTSDQWLSEFFPAELDYVQHVAADYARDVCAPAYDEVLMNLPPLPLEPSAAIVQSLRQLRAAARQTWVAARQPAAVVREVSMPEPFAPLKVPDLREHEFQSTVPIIGPLIAGLRRGLYSVTAKWPLRVAFDQQMRINRQLAQRLAEHEVWLAHYQSQLRDYENQLRGYEAQLRDYEAQLRDYDERLIDQDHDLAHLSRVTAEVELRQRHLTKPQASPQP
jgi:hypothetical protein